MLMACGEATVTLSLYELRKGAALDCQVLPDNCLPGICKTNTGLASVPKPSPSFSLGRSPGIILVATALARSTSC